MIEVLDPGPFTTVQDLGRRGHGHLGVPPSGAVDRDALALANRIVANRPTAAGLEMTIGGPTLRVRVATTLALTGAPLPLFVDNRPVPPGTPIRVPAGAVVHGGTISRGLRSYLAFRGGIQVPAVLGSRSTDVLTGLGPAPLQPGHVLPLGTDTNGWPNVDFVSCPEIVADPVLRLVLGPHLRQHFSEDALEALTTEPFLVSPDSNRVAIRLTGPSIPRVDGEVASEGLTTGAIQVPPSRQPIVFLTDHPTTGGYPVIGVLTAASLRAAAQVRPGNRVRFTTVQPTNNLSRAAASGRAH
jgi:biotin-dependent carboxylase-like uncharacterized protein